MIINKDMTLDVAFDLFELECEYKNLAKRTIKAYREKFEYFRRIFRSI